MRTVRLHFSKTFDAKYISHLDLSRCFARAIKASGVPVWFTEGYHTHLYLTFALPLSLGFESICEVVDIRLVDEIVDPYIKEKVNAHLPHGIEVFNVAEAKMAPSDIAWARYFIEIGGPNTDEILAAAQELMARGALPAEKKGKKGQIAVVDLKPMIHRWTVEMKGDFVHFDIVSAAGSERSFNPMLLLGLLGNMLQTAPIHQLIKRVQILNRDMQNFE